MSGRTSGGSVEINIDLPEGTYLYYKGGLPAAKITLRAAE